MLCLFIYIYFTAIYQATYYSNIKIHLKKENVKMLATAKCAN